MEEATLGKKGGGPKGQKCQSFKTVQTKRGKARRCKSFK